MKHSIPRYINAIGGFVRIPIILLSFFAIINASPAALLIYEGFDYALSDEASMNGVATTATGLTGSYTATNVNSASSTYATSGLSFGNFLPTSGGALAMTATTSNTTQAVSTLGAQLNTGTQTGTIWTSFLIEFSEYGANLGSSTTRLNTTGPAGPSSNGQFISQSDSTADQGKPKVGYDNITAGNAAFTLSLNTTYLVVSSFTNVGSALSSGSPGVATLWVFDQVTYNDWLAGGAEESALTEFAYGMVTENQNSGAFTFGDDRYLQFVVATGAAAGTQTVTYDELRYGTALTDVVAVPEPAAIGMLIMAPVLLFVFNHAARGQNAQKRRNAI